ncbi:MAG: hypothetical protein K8S23_10150 [Candidatus Cloacimonetes bacterium]|nr:hypothetical protein [Candidatus Cloacimonadota bacterium]
MNARKVLNKRILFYDKEIKLAYPKYAIKLLKELENRGYKLLILYDQPDLDSKETIAGVKLDEIYKSFDSIRVTSWDVVVKSVSMFSPDIYLSSLSLFGFERKILEYIYSKNIKIFEMDTIASEIMRYNYDWRYTSKVNKQIMHRLKNIFRSICISLNIEKYLPRKILGVHVFYKQLELISDFISLRGIWSQNFLTINNQMGYSKNRFPITGSIQLDVLCNKIYKKEILFSKLGYDINKKTVLILPSLAWLKDKKDETFFNFITNSLIKKGCYNIAIQPHPADRIKNPNRYKKLKHLIIHPLYFYPILQHSDLVCCPRSSVFFETAIAKIPLFFASHQKKTIEMPTITTRYKIVTFVSTKNFERKLDEVISKKEKFYFDDFIKDFCFSDDGFSYKRVANKIEEIL